MIKLSIHNFWPDFNYDENIFISMLQDIYKDELIVTNNVNDCNLCLVAENYVPPEIDTIFNKDGIIILDDNFDINKLSPEYYWSKMNAIKENYELCLNHKIADDCLFEQIEKEIHNDTYNL